MENNPVTKYDHRFIARIVLEAETPLAVGSGEKDMLTDALIATDVNWLPYIPATSLAGILRGMVRAQADDSAEALFGFQKGNDGRGSEIIFTEARILDSNGKVVDGMNQEAIIKDGLLKHYQILPIRQHVRITGKGVAADGGKFDEQVVYAGTRFCFEIEMVSDGKNFGLFKSLLCNLYAGSFRVGSGTRNGFGKVKIVDLRILDLDLSKKNDLELYLGKSSDLGSDFWKDHMGKEYELADTADKDRDYICYNLTLKPESFFLFGSGFGDDEADMTPVKAKKVEWTGPKGKLVENLVLIPATSVKGALAHRVAFHWNRLNNIIADDLENGAMDKKTGKYNEAVRLLFGSEGDNDESDITRGNVIFSDIIKGLQQNKILNHVAIDRFTGGSLAGALFSEKVTFGSTEEYKTEIMIDKKNLDSACQEVFKEKNSGDDINRLIISFEAALDDLCKGMLPLGGGVNRGHGVFTGKYTKKTAV